MESPLKGSRLMTGQASAWRVEGWLAHVSSLVNVLVVGGNAVKAPTILANPHQQALA
jgi:hypothetical protein